MNDSVKKDYENPCPSAGVHQYLFTVYPLDAEEFFSTNKINFLDEVKEHMLTLLN